MSLSLKGWRRIWQQFSIVKQRQWAPYYAWRLGLWVRKYIENLKSRDVCSVIARISLREPNATGAQRAKPKMQESSQCFSRRAWWHQDPKESWISTKKQRSSISLKRVSKDQLSLWLLTYQYLVRLQKLSAIINRFEKREMGNEKRD